MRIAQGSATNFKFEDAVLPNGRFKAVVRAVSNSGFVREATSASFIVDSSPPRTLGAPRLRWEMHESGWHARAGADVCVPVTASSVEVEFEFNDLESGVQRYAHRPPS